VRGRGDRQGSPVRIEGETCHASRLLGDVAGTSVFNRLPHDYVVPVLVKSESKVASIVNDPSNSTPPFSVSLPSWFLKKHVSGIRERCKWGAGTEQRFENIITVGRQHTAFGRGYAVPLQSFVGRLRPRALQVQRVPPIARLPTRDDCRGVAPEERRTFATHILRMVALPGIGSGHPGGDCRNADLLKIASPGFE